MTKKKVPADELQSLIADAREGAKIAREGLAFIEDAKESMKHKPKFKPQLKLIKPHK